ncbi:unnamed protein product [Ilex paraguariensis]|uniref:Uncharacterized protein n=1 Tax=Ilex paraguariensis TaxID=185542 RepID=A0ABC8TEF8_9AQUA
MAIDMCSECSNIGTSPRISFSHDLLHSDSKSIENYHPSRSDSSLLDSDSSEFDFCVSNNIEREISAADELFSDGLILPLQLEEKFITSKPIYLSKPQPLSSLPPLPVPPTNENSKPKSSKEIIFDSDQKHQSRPFWRIKRSSSVHGDNSYKKGSFWSLPLLSRSNSTGSVPSSKQTLKDSQKQNSNKHGKGSMAVSSASSPSFYTYPLSQKPPLNKNYGGSYGHGVRISPVLNVPPPYISKGTANLFGLGSFFGNGGKDKKNKK